MTQNGRPPLPDGLDDLVAELTSVLGDEDVARRALVELRDELIEEPSPAVADQHLAAMRTAAGGAPQVIDLRSRRVRRAVTGTTIGLLALGATGGLAAAGVLPPVVQDAVSRAANVLSIDLPRSTPTTVELVDLPGLSGTPPGTNAPGRTGQTPGQTGQTPATTAPGRTGESPGRTGENPGATAPGRTGETPGRTGETPSATAPGQTGETPSATAPGQTGENPGATAPGQTGENPGATAPGQPGTTVPPPSTTDTTAPPSPPGPPAGNPGQGGGPPAGNPGQGGGPSAGNPGQGRGQG